MSPFTLLCYFNMSILCILLLLLLVFKAWNGEAPAYL